MIGLKLFKIETGTPPFFHGKGTVSGLDFRPEVQQRTMSIHVNSEQPEYAQENGNGNSKKTPFECHHVTNN